MGISGISLWQLLIVLLIVVLIFGTKKLRTLGGDLGGAVKSFRKAMGSAEEDITADDEKKDPEKLESAEPDADFEPAEKREQETNGASR